MEKFDIIIIGAGPGGYTAAIESGKNGLKTGIIDMDKIGGTCLNYGCIPTKTLYYFANIFYKLNKLQKSNILEYSIKYKWEDIIKYKTNVVNKLIKGIEYLFKKNNVTFIQGRANLIDKNNISINNKTSIYAEKIIIATGSTDIIPPMFRNSKFYTTNNFWGIEQPHGKLIIIGAGIIGIELASILSQLNFEIILIEKTPSILPGKDKKIVSLVKKFFLKNNIKLYTDVNITKSYQKENKTTVILDNDEKIIGDYLLIVTGRKPNITIDNEKLGIETENGFIKVNNNYSTSIDNIFAIGDVINKNNMFAHLASFQAVQVIKHISGKKFVKFNKYSVPYTIFTFPQISGIEISRDSDTEKKSLSYIANSMGKISNLTEGFFNIEILGNKPVSVSLASNYANEIINLYSFIINNSLEMKYIENSIFTHPSESEIILG